jgi:SUR7/PalI family
VLLAGAINGFPVNQIYFLQAETRGIPGAMDISRWTLWNICGDSNGYDVKCGKINAAFPFDPQSNFGTQDKVPQPFIG